MRASRPGSPARTPDGEVGPMLTDFREMLCDAYRDHTAVGAFNAYNYETIRGIWEAGRQRGGPVIVAFGQKYLANMRLADVSAVVRSLAESDPMPVCLHLDHCSDPEIIRQAIEAGFSSVMYDGSALPYAENAENTKKVCEYAHARSVSVEAELGSLAAGERSHEGSAADREDYTDPEKAGEFAAYTGVDALAVSIGTVHGLYRGTPHIRIDILREINEACGIPLVLHGGSGTPEEAIRAAIANGICKINVNTEISVYTVEKLRHLLSEKSPHLSELSKWEEKAVSEVVLKYMDFFLG